MLRARLSRGRYKASIVQKEAYLTELSRYLVLNPVRARMVARPEDWEFWGQYIKPPAVPGTGRFRGQ